MNAFFSIPELWQMVIPVLLLAEAVLELGLFLYQTLRSKNLLRGLPCALFFVILAVLLLSVTQGDPDEGKDAFLLGAPWVLFAAVILLAAVHFAVAFPREYRRSKSELSPLSIKEATDKLPMGICFADPDGRIILCNNKMRKLSFLLCGRAPQMSEDLAVAIAVPDESVTVTDSECYIMPDKTVWQFCTQLITVDGDGRWSQTTAHNVTELYNGNLRQKEINAKLQEVNRKLQKMYERMADDIREKESLDLKIYIHDTIGRSLLTIRDIIGSGEDAGKKLEALQEAVSVLTSNRTAPGGTMDEVKETAGALGITVAMEGYLPPDSMAEALLVAAAKECITNCIKHAGGSRVHIRIAEQGKVYNITITNNGAVPAGPIIEGSGLSSLRRSIEAADGEMHIAYKPRFALLITLQSKEDDL